MHCHPLSPLLCSPSAVPPSPHARKVSQVALAELESNVLLLVGLRGSWIMIEASAPLLPPLLQGEPLVSAMLDCQELLKLLVNRSS